MRESTRVDHNQRGCRGQRMRYYSRWIVGGIIRQIMQLSARTAVDTAYELFWADSLVLIVARCSDKIQTRDSNERRFYERIKMCVDERRDFDPWILKLNKDNFKTFLWGITCMKQYFTCFLFHVLSNTVLFQGLLEWSAVCCYCPLF